MNDLSRVSAGGNFCSGLPCWVRCWRPLSSGNPGTVTFAAQAHKPAAWRSEDPWKTLAEVQEHMFPAAADAPGASDIGAIVYLHNTIENPAADGEDREFLFNGVGWLNDLAREKTGHAFVALDEQQKETLLRQIEESRAGRNWLSLLLTYVLEALLADPVYGGNPDGIGWKWLEHQPGYPTAARRQILVQTGATGALPAQGLTDEPRLRYLCDWQWRRWWPGCTDAGGGGLFRGGAGKRPVAERSGFLQG